MAMQFPIIVFNFWCKINTNFQNFELENHYHRTRIEKTKSTPKRHKTFPLITIIEELASTAPHYIHHIQIEFNKIQSNLPQNHQIHQA